MEMKERPFKDERDRQIDISADHHALEFVKAGIQVFTIASLLKKNPAWKAGLSLLFIGSGAELLDKYEKYNDKPHLCIGDGMGIIGSAMLLRFRLKDECQKPPPD